MCHVTIYVFRCGHPATKPFVTQRCIFEQGGARCVDMCEALGRKTVVDLRCPACSASDPASAFRAACSPNGLPYLSYLDGDNPLRGRHAREFPGVWDVPCRTFVDRGFRTLDPFGEDERTRRWDWWSSTSSAAPPAPPRDEDDVDPPSPKTQSRKKEREREIEMEREWETDTDMDMDWERDGERDRERKREKEKEKRERKRKEGRDQARVGDAKKRRR